MVTKRGSLLHSLDWFAITLFLILVVMGWFSICGASYDYMDVNFFSFDQRTGKQAVWIACSLFLALALLLCEKRFYENFAYLFYIGLLLLGIATIFLGRDIKGSHSWLVLGPVSLQPAEFTKFATALALAKVMNSFQFSLEKTRDFITCLVIILLPMLIIMAQKETGSALVYIAFFLVLYREGMSGSVLFLGLCTVLFFILCIRYNDVYLLTMPVKVGTFVVLLLIQLFTVCVTFMWCKGRQRPFLTVLLINAGGTLVGYLFSRYFIPFNVTWVQLLMLLASAVYLFVHYLLERAKCYLWVLAFSVASVAFMYSSEYVFQNVLQAHQKVRIQVVLGLKEDLTGAGYNVNQSLIAIGSGGMTGKGFLNGTQTKLKYVPEQDTDFIFCTIGEEQGFLGASFVILVFMALILRIIVIAERQVDAFGRVYGYSVASIFLFHLFINIGMVLGLTPVIGIPLPFFSYGGSSLWGFTLLLFILLRIDAERNIRA